MTLRKYTVLAIFFIYSESEHNLRTTFLPKKVPLEKISIYYYKSNRSFT